MGARSRADSATATGRAETDGRVALRAAVQAFAISRLLVVIGSAIGIYGFGTGAYQQITELPDPRDSIEGILLSPFKRWDAGWFLGIADHGYDNPTPDATAFFPLYPATIRIVGGVVGSYAWAGVLVSLVALLVALYLLHRLTALEAGRGAADRAVLLLALYPMSFYLSAIYSESLFLALTIGCIYSARHEWWGRTALLGAVASACRNTGVLLVIPVAIMMLYGPRNDRSPGPVREPWPRFRLSLRELGVLGAMPLGLVAYSLYIRQATRFGLLAPAKAHAEWSRGFRGPIVGYWGGIKNSLVGLRDLVSGTSVTEPVSGMRSGLINGAALAFASTGIVGAVRRLPVAYWAYALAGLVVMISFPPENLQAKSLSRLIIVLFPLFMWAGIATEKASHRNVALPASAAGLVLFSAMFASGYWVA